MKIANLPSATYSYSSFLPSVGLGLTLNRSTRTLAPDERGDLPVPSLLELQRGLHPLRLGEQLLQLGRVDWLGTWGIIDIVSLVAITIALNILAYALSKRAQGDRVAISLSLIHI